MLTSSPSALHEVMVSRLPGWKKHFVFLSGSTEAASLEYHKVIGRAATLTIGSKKWTLQGKGFIKQQIFITAEQSPYTKTQFSFSWCNRFTLRAEDGEIYQFRKQKWWKTCWAWYNEQQDMRVKVHSNRLSRKNRGKITFVNSPGEQDLWLALLGWYLMVAAEENAAASSGFA